MDSNNEISNLYRLLDNIFKKIDSMDKKSDILDMRIDSIDKTLVKQELNIEKHIKRSDTLEQIMNQMREDMKPVEKHVIMVEGVFKFLGVLSLVGGILKAFGVI